MALKRELGRRRNLGRRDLERRSRVDEHIDNRLSIVPHAAKLTAYEAELERKVEDLEGLVEMLSQSVDNLTEECDALKVAVEEAMGEVGILEEKLTGAERTLKEEQDEKLKYWEALTESKNLVRVLEAAVYEGSTEYAGFSQNPYLCDPLL